MKITLTKTVNIAAEVKCPVLVYLLFYVCYPSPTTELLATVMRLLNDYSRIHPHADRCEVAVDYSVHRLVDSLDRGAQCKWRTVCCTASKVYKPYQSHHALHTSN